MKRLILVLASLCLLSCQSRRSERVSAVKTYTALVAGELIRCTHPGDTDKPSMCVVRKDNCRLLVAVMDADLESKVVHPRDKLKRYCDHPNKKWKDGWCYASGGGYNIYDCPDCGKKGFKEYLGEDLKTVLPTMVVKSTKKTNNE